MGFILLEIEVVCDWIIISSCGFYTQSGLRVGFFGIVWDWKSLPQNLFGMQVHNFSAF